MIEEEIVGWRSDFFLAWFLRELAWHANVRCFFHFEGKMGKITKKKKGCWFR